ncbi:MAG: 2-oxoacid:acceptor oxidoreductase family protein, partial [Caldilineaceae bacterium]|nr:2-oxoacid:acceptor oxidoreductase family protein [Caldilineaceae bacterium]
DAVAMTGGQPVDGRLSVDAIARQVESEGVREVAVVSDDIAKYDAIKSRFPAGTSFHHRDELDAVQRRLRTLAGVTVLIYEQTCAAEKRRRRKKGQLDDPALRLFINEHVCEGCGDCGVQSNCVAVLPHETPLGRKRRIDQSACNKDYSCAKGFCPSFVGVTGGTLRRKPGVLGRGEEDFLRHVAALPRPADHVWTGPYDLLVTGVGGTGVVTVGALIAMAAHLEGKAASVLDFMGFAQKGGSVLSFVRWADRPERLNQVRIDTQQADAVLACDLVVGASADALGTVRRGRTRILANVHEVPVAESLKNPDASLKVPALLAKLRFAAGADASGTAARLRPLTAEVTFYAVSELVRNAARHGRSADGPLSLTVTVEGGADLTVAVQDNGTGGPALDPDAGAGQGLALHAAMLAIVGGTLSVTPGSEGGINAVIRVKADSG